MAKGTGGEKKHRWENVIFERKKGGRPLKNQNKWQLHNGSFTDDREIVIGFDFGTACTKIVLQDRQLRKSYAVPFGKFAAKPNPYLIPSALYFSSTGIACLESGPKKVSGLKIRYLQNPGRITVQNRTKGEFWTNYHLISAYIALVLMEVRNWFWSTKAQGYQHVNISWQLNIGLPALSYDDDYLTKKMRMAALNGWNISLLAKKSEIILSEVNYASTITKKQFDNNCYETEKGQLHPDDVNTIPEIIAQVIGYVRSPLRRWGMYLLIDIGASTLDAATFIIFKDEGEDLYNVLFAEVKKLGAYALHHHRIKLFRKLIELRINELKTTCDGINPLPDPADYHLKLEQDDEKIISTADNKFSCACSKVIRIVLKETKEKKNPLANEWSKGLPVFLCGGGGKIKLYRDVLKGIETNMQSINFPGFDYRNLPKPDNLEALDISPREYHRIAVSYGLSFSGIDIGKIISPGENKDLVIEENGGRRAVETPEDTAAKGRDHPEKPNTQKIGELRSDKFDYFNDWSAVKD